MDTSSRSTIMIIILGVVLIGLSIFWSTWTNNFQHTHKSSGDWLAPRLFAYNHHLEWPAEQGGTMSMDIIVCLGNTSTDPRDGLSQSSGVGRTRDTIKLSYSLRLDGKGTTADQEYKYELKHTLGSEEEININGSSYSTKNGLVFVVTDGAIHQINRKDLHFSDISEIKDALLAEVRKAIDS